MIILTFKYEAIRNSFVRYAYNEDYLFLSHNGEDYKGIWAYWDGKEWVE